MTTRRFPVFLAVVTLLVALLALWWAHRDPAPSGSGGYAGSAACRQCHSHAYETWVPSHHARAEQVLDAGGFAAGFGGDREVQEGSRPWKLQVREDRVEVIAAGEDGAQKTFPALRAIGVSPLRQLLLDAPGGRLQVTSIAYDPARHEWFGVFGDEERRPGDWGFWAGRGMTWNSMCATCHTTRLAKNYDPAKDEYRTEYLELGVGCESCHGPGGEHASARSAGRDPGPLRTVRPLDTCGACHARREDLTGGFHPGALFLDHYRLVTPDRSDVYYPDGQVHDEDFEYGSFLGSRMATQGVTCLDCHDAHSAKTKAPGNALCLRCHEKTGMVDVAAHARHRPDTPGGHCVDCHMPITPYMQRHPRRDHGFTIPDPLLTVEFGIPNACNRCHQDRSPAWALESVQAWYGERMDRPTRRRARVLARAKREPTELALLPELLGLARSDVHPHWRVVATGFLEPWADRADVRLFLLAALTDPDAMLRATAVRLLERVAADHVDRLVPLLDDPVRLVRIDAAWTLRRSLDLSTRAGHELLDYLACNSDQPVGSFRRAVFFQDRRDPANAVRWIRHAARLDPSSADIFRALAYMERDAGNFPASDAGWRKAVALSPENAPLAFECAIFLAQEAEGPRAARDGRRLLGESRELLERATKLDPGMSRAWYNLALVRDRLGGEDALAAVDRAMSLDPSQSDFFRARIAILRRLHRSAEALETLPRLESLQPGEPELLRLRAAILLELGREAEARAALDEYQARTRDRRR